MSVSTSSRLSGSFSSGFAGSGSGVSSGGSAASSPGADGFASGGFSGSLFCPPQAVSSSASSKHTVKILRFIPFTPRSLIRCHANTRKIQDLHWFRPWPKPDAAHGYIGAGFQRRPQCHKQAHLYMLIISIPCGNSSGPHRSPLQVGKGSTGNSESRLPRRLQSFVLSTQKTTRSVSRLTAWFHKYSVFTVRNFSFSTRWQRPDRVSGCCWAYKCWCRWRSTPQ